MKLGVYGITLLLLAPVGICLRMQKEWPQDTVTASVANPGIEYIAQWTSYRLPIALHDYEIHEMG